MSIANTNPDTGIRYGVISGNSLDSDLFNELFYGSQALNLSEEEAFSSLCDEIKRDADNIEEECRIAVHERDPLLGDRDYEILLEAEIEAAYGRLGYQDRDDYVDTRYDREREYIQCDEPIIEGELDGVKYRISWLGGASLVWATGGLQGYANRLCSPCVPNAADLDGGFYTPGEIDPILDMSYHCYIVPRDWISKENT